MVELLETSHVNMALAYGDWQLHHQGKPFFLIV